MRSGIQSRKRDVQSNLHHFHNHGSVKLLDFQVTENRIAGEFLVFHHILNCDNQDKVIVPGHIITLLHFRYFQNLALEFIDDVRAVANEGHLHR